MRPMNYIENMQAELCGSEYSEINKGVVERTKAYEEGSQ